MNLKTRLPEKQKRKTTPAKWVKPHVPRVETAVLPSPIPALQPAYTDPRTLSPADAHLLQRTIGNQALRRLTIQRKMTVGPVGDKYEQEADAVAKQVVGKLQAPQTQTSGTETVQRQEDEEELQMKPLPAISSLQRQEDEEELQMKPLVQRQEDEEELQAKSETTKGDPMLTGGELSGDVESSVQSAKSGGQAMPDAVRAPMENAFNTDFSHVKLHTDSTADSLNRALSARAFTSGQDVFFRSGEYNPGSTGGQELLAHELTHTIQQTGSTPIQRQQQQTTDIAVKQTAPADLVSLKRRKMYLDFVRVKKKDTQIAKMLLSKIGITNAPSDAYGHWWLELGDKTGGAMQGGNWTPTESYGWWPSQSVNIEQTFKGVPGNLNRGNASEDPHHGDTAETEYHPVKMVDEQEDYETVRNEVVNDIRQFAHGFQGSWNWRLGWGKNCHTFLDRLKKRTHLHHQKGENWLLRPHGTDSMSDMADAEEDRAHNERVLTSITGTGFGGLGDDTLDYLDTSLLTSNLNLDADDYDEIDDETRAAILAYLEVSAAAMNDYLQRAFGDELENHF